VSKGFQNLVILLIKERRMFRSIVVCVIAIGFFGMRPDSQWQADSSPSVGAPTAEQYRKFERLLAFVRARNARNYAISSPNSIDEGNYVPVGGIEQWITIRGEDRNNPVLLFVHGGPGDVTNPWSFAFFAPWEKYFTIVQWD
jgi:hypothetical protein